MQQTMRAKITGEIRRIIPALDREHKDKKKVHHNIITIPKQGNVSESATNSTTSQQKPLPQRRHFYIGNKLQPTGIRPAPPIQGEKVPDRNGNNEMHEKHPRGRVAYIATQAAQMHKDDVATIINDSYNNIPLLSTEFIEMVLDQTQLVGF